MRVFIIIGIVFAIFLLSISMGAVSLNILDMNELQRGIMLRVRLPRVLLAGMVGAALANSGVLFQYVMKNPLADSFTTGVSASSAIGAVSAIMLGLTPMIPIFGLIGGLAGLYLVYTIANYRGRIQPITMLLAGIVLSTFASAVISLLKFYSDTSVSSIIFWLMGGFSSATPAKALVVFIAVLFSFVIVRRDYLGLDIICFDDTTAISSGIDVYAMRKRIFFIAALLTSFSVGYAGIIGFVGLVVPHILRFAGFIRASEIMPVSIIAGAGFMMLTDLIARVILTGGAELPVGIITSFIGGAFFLYLLVLRKKELYYFN